MGFHYFYRHIKLNGKQGAKRPVVPVNINGYEFTGLVDSGSDSIVIPEEIAEALELKEIDKTELSQLDGGITKCGICEVQLEFGKGHENYLFRCKALISKSPRLILGRKGFFEQFLITFNEDRSIVSFKKMQPSKKQIW